MKLIRLPSGPLACVFPLEVETQEGSPRAKKISGVYRAFSGSVEADGSSEAQAIQALDEEVRRLSVPPPAEIEEFELERAANDVMTWNDAASATVTGRYPRYSEHPTVPAPVSSSRH
jgi:hypothetical protein